MTRPKWHLAEFVSYVIINIGTKKMAVNSISDFQCPVYLPLPDPSGDVENLFFFVQSGASPIEKNKKLVYMNKFHWEDGSMPFNARLSGKGVSIR